jgi:hypothetical protein
MYIEKIGDPIPLYEIMGNQIFEEKFHNDASAVYAYCLENNKTWEEVLDHHYDEDVMY